MSTPQPELRRERRMPVRTIGAVSASVIAFPLLAAPAEAATIPYPKPSRTLPAALDVAAFYQEGTRCLTENQPGAVAFAKLLNATYGTRTYGILRKCAAEHGEGRALDWMINANNAQQLALANALTRWLVAPDAQGRPGAMARRFGINYIIWNRKIWKAWAPERGWISYYGVSPHTDHIHFSFNWDGAYKRTSWWSGVAVTKPLTGPTGSATPAPAPAPVITASGYPLLEQGATGAEVALAQKVIGTAPDGRFGPLTATALAAWQSRNGLAVTKKLDNATWSAMVALELIPSRAPAHPLEKYVDVVLRRGATGAAVKALQGAIGQLTVDGSYGPATEARVKEYQASKRLAVTGITDRSVWNALMGKAVTPAPAPAPTPTTPTPSVPTPTPSTPSGSVSTTTLARYSALTLKLWSRGEAVKALQKALGGGLAVDGVYGRATEARVKAYQKSKGQAVTGVAGPKVWKALAAGPVQVPAPGASVGTTASALATEFTAYKATVLKAGSRGAAVKVLQRALGGLVVDGAFGSRTLASVKRFQTSRHLPATGVVDAKTWTALELAKHPLLPYWGTVLKPGAKGAAVVALQKALRIKADGTYGASTVTAVKALQKAARLAQTGVVGSVTWKAVEARMPR